MAKSKNRQYAEMIHSALESIGEMKGSTMFVKVERVMRRKTMDPTERQASLLRFIKKKGFVPREWTLGMHWGMLGGLMARGLVVNTTKDGREGVECS